jgi:hypothetical protein
VSVGGCGLALVVVRFVLSCAGGFRVCVRVSVSRLVRVSVSRLVRACVLSWDVIVVFPETRSRMFENAAPADESR